MKEWDDSIVDFAAPADGFLTRAFGGRSGPLALENGAALTFPWQTQQQIVGTVPGTVVSYDDTDGSPFTVLSLEGPTMLAGSSRAFVELRGFDDGVPQLKIGDGVANNYITINDANMTLSTTGSQLILDTGATLTSLAGTVDITAETAIQISNDTTNGTTITIDSNAALNLVGVPVNINGVDASTSLGAWTTFTSGLIQSGAPTFTATYCRYRKRGREVTVSCFLNITATGSAVAGNRVQITLPFTAVQAGNHCTGAGYIVGAGTQRNGHVLFPSTTVAALSPSSVDGGGYLGATHWTGVLTAGDVVSMTFTYEATT